MIDNSVCCKNRNNGQGNWYDVTGGEVQQGPDGDSDLYVTRGDGVFYFNRRRGGCTAEHLHLPWDKDNKYDVIADQFTLRAIFCWLC